MNNNKDILLEKIASRTARVGVIGLGYVGLPLVVEFADSGFDSTGFEVDARKADTINRGESYIPDVSTPHLADLVAAKKLSATTDFALLKEQDIIIICVPTPLRKTKDPDVSFILAASEKIQAGMRPGQLIILESTTYPGTTDEVLKPMFDETGFKLDKDYFLAFSPERVDPGNEKYNTKNITKVVGGVTAVSAEVAAAAYSAIVDRVHPVSSARVAETCKLLENTFRAVNIGLVNELAQLCHTLNIDTWEVIAAAATKPFGFMPFYPGPGIGGHCLVGSELTVVRSAADHKQRVETLADLFIRCHSDDANEKFGFENGEVVRFPQLETLSLNPETNQQEWKPISYLFRRRYEGRLVTITTSDNRRLTITDEHPMLVSDDHGNLRQVFAKDVAVGERLPIHSRPFGTADSLAGLAEDATIDLLPLLPRELKSRIRVRIIGGNWRDHREALKTKLTPPIVQEFIRQDYLPLDSYLSLEQSGAVFIPHDSLQLWTGRGPSTSSFPAVVRFTPDVARFIGYYLAEGCITREGSGDRVRLSFNRAEVEFINDVRAILKNEFGLPTSTSDSRIDQVTHIRIASAVLGWLLGELIGCGRNSLSMRVPDVLINSSPTHQRELLKGLMRGDGDVYVHTGPRTYQKHGHSYVSQDASAEVGYFSSSPILFQQVIYLLQGMGFTPTFKRTKPHLQLKGFSQLNHLRDWLGTKGARLEDYFATSQRISAGRTFKRVGGLITVPVKSIEIKPADEPMWVYSMEVEENHTFATSYGVFVHNCIPLDPHYLSWKARMHGFEARFISLADEVNSRMPEHVVGLISKGLNTHRKPVNGSKVLIMGVAYKRDIDDMRESPALAIIEQLQELGAEVCFHDPYVAEIHLEGNGSRLKGVGLNQTLVAESDCVVIVTDHGKIDYGWVAENARLIVDTRNTTRELRGERFDGKIIRL